jgi:opacity protein-like surface antigen
MRKTVCLFTLVSSIFVSAAGAYAEPYFSVYGGLVQPHEAALTNNVSGETGEMTFRDSSSVGLKAGYWFPAQDKSYSVGLQLDANAYKAHIKELVDSDGTVAPVTSNTDFIAVALNAVFRAEVESVRPYAGAGAGWYYLNVGVGNKPVPAVGIGSAGWTSSSDSAVGFQAFAGVDIPLTKSLAFLIEYKFLMAEFSFTENIYFPLDLDYESSQLYAGLTYSF